MKTIIELGNEADLLTWGFVSLEYEVVPDFEAVERFAALVRADEREACAKVCDDIERAKNFSGPMHCAAAIRARGNT